MFLGFKSPAFKTSTDIVEVQLLKDEQYDEYVLLTAAEPKESSLPPWLYLAFIGGLVLIVIMILILKKVFSGAGSKGTKTLDGS